MVKRTSSKNCTSRIDWSPKNQSGPRTVVESSFGTIAESGHACHALALCQQPWKSCVFGQWCANMLPTTSLHKAWKNVFSVETFYCLKFQESIFSLVVSKYDVNMGLMCWAWIKVFTFWHCPKHHRITKSNRSWFGQERLQLWCANIPLLWLLLTAATTDIVPLLIVYYCYW